MGACTDAVTLSSGLGRVSAETTDHSMKGSQTSAPTAMLPEEHRHHRVVTQGQLLEVVVETEQKCGGDGENEPGHARDLVSFRKKGSPFRVSEAFLAGVLRDLTF